MTLNLSAPTQAITSNVTIPINSLNGTGPYTYSVKAGGIGGTIDSNGNYTSPNALGTDTIIVTDSLANSGQLLINVLHPIDLICDIIQKELDLTQGRVFLYNQKIKQPVDNNLFVVIQVLNSKAFSNTNRPLASVSGLNAEASINMQTTLSIDIKSRGIDALYRKEEVLMALNSDYAQQQQMINAFYVAKTATNFVNLSELDGSAIPYRFNISVNIQYVAGKVKSVPYYDNFENVEITTN